MDWGADSTVARGSRDPSTGVDSVRRIRDLVDGLVKMGCSRSDAERRIAEAVRMVKGAEPAGRGRLPAIGPEDESEILLRALRAS